jgi:hypothetical protein
MFLLIGLVVGLVLAGRVIAEQLQSVRRDSAERGARALFWGSIKNQYRIALRMLAPALIGHLIDLAIGTTITTLLG